MFPARNDNPQAPLRFESKNPARTVTHIATVNHNPTAYPGKMLFRARYEIGPTGA